MDFLNYCNYIYKNYAALGVKSALQSKYSALEYNFKPHLSKGATLLDIGSGQGEFLDVCRHLGINASGVTC
jgi:cyclopropane fatty-acyl-phospholipid synthase-like methyltransferase